MRAGEHLLAHDAVNLEGLTEPMVRCAHPGHRRLTLALALVPGDVESSTRSLRPALAAVEDRDGDGDAEIHSVGVRLLDATVEHTDVEVRDGYRLGTQELGLGRGHRRVLDEHPRTVTDTLEQGREKR